MGSNLQSCINLPSAGITAMCHHFQPKYGILFKGNVNRLAFLTSIYLFLASYRNFMDFDVLILFPDLAGFILV
jgi:hypothetical protein